MNKGVETLKERAEQLAKPIKEVTIKGNLIEVLLFRLSQELYGIETKYIQEVCIIKDYTFIPCAPPFLFGVMNVRSRILPLINLKTVFELPETEEKNLKCIILKGEEREFAIVIDELIKIHHIPSNQLQIALPTFSSQKEEFLQGITPDRLIILDGKKLLLNKRLVVDETV